MANARIYRLSHCTYICQYHLVWTPKYRGKILADNYIKTELKRIFKMICKWKRFKILAWHIGDEHIHVYLIITTQVLRFIRCGDHQRKIQRLDQEKNQKIPTGNTLVQRLFHLNHRLESYGCEEIYRESTKKPKRPANPLLVSD